MNNLDNLLSSDALLPKSLQSIICPNSLTSSSPMDPDSLWCNLKARQMGITTPELLKQRELWKVEDQKWCRGFLRTNFLVMPPCQCIEVVLQALDSYASLCAHYPSMRHFRDQVLGKVNSNIEFYIEALTLWSNLYLLIIHKMNPANDIRPHDLINITNIYKDLCENYIPILGMFGLLPLECRVKRLLQKYVGDLIWAMKSKVEIYGHQKFQRDELTCYEVAMDILRCIECVLNKVHEYRKSSILMDLVDEEPLRSYAFQFIDFFYHILYFLFTIQLYKPSNAHKVFELIAIWRVQGYRFIEMFPGTHSRMIKIHSGFLIQMVELTKSHSTDLKVRCTTSNKGIKNEEIEMIAKVMMIILNLLRLREKLVKFIQSTVQIPSSQQAIQELEDGVKSGSLYKMQQTPAMAVYSSAIDPFMEVDISEEALCMDDFYIVADDVQGTITLKCRSLVALQLLHHRNQLIQGIFPLRPSNVEFSQEIETLDTHLLKCVDNLIKIKTSLVSTISLLSQVPSEYLIIRIAELALRYIQNPISGNVSEVVKSLINCLACWISAMCSQQGQLENKTFFKSSVTNLGLLLKALRVNDAICDMDEETFEFIQERVGRVVSLLLAHFEAYGHEVEAKEFTDASSFESIWDLDTSRDSFLRDAGIIGRALDNNGANPKIRENKFDFEWRRLKKVGDGANGTVYQCLNLSTGKIIAVKQVKINEQVDCSYVAREGRLMQTLHHPNTVNCYGVEMTADMVNIFMEYCSGGTLLKLIAENGMNDEHLIYQLLLQIVRGLAYLHDKGIVHGDLKPQNIFFDDKGNIRLGDFGAARNFREEDLLKSLSGTPSYMAPECLLKNSVDTAGDIWSLGCTLLHMITGKRPWSQFDNEWTMMFHLGRDGNLPTLPKPSSISPQLNSILRKCLTRDHEERPTAKTLLSMPFLSRTFE